MDSNTAIRIALETLVVQPEDACPFVIVEDAESKKFVQFVGSLDKPLLLDLPAQTLSEAEFYRAVTFFRRRGVAGQEYELLDAPGGRPVGEQFTFQLLFHSVDSAVEAVFGVFEQVYLLPDCQLSVIAG
jgi:hypothetical protein